MEIILSQAPSSSSSSYFTNMNWQQQQQQAKWTQEENKLFENALAVYDKETPDRWHKVANMIPGKTAEDVVRQYQALEADVSDIEAGLVPVPGYSSNTNNNNNNNSSIFTFELMNSNVITSSTSCAYDQDGFQQHFSGFIGKRSNSMNGRGSDQERKKGVAWTEDEHKLFLMGLKKYGKGDWRNISRNFVTTRTPTQVASHAQKYFIRQVSGGKDKRRASIHDITTVSDDTRTPSPEGGNKTAHSSPDESPMTMNQNYQQHHAHYDQWAQPHTASVSTLSINGRQEANTFVSLPYGVEPFAANLQRDAAYHDPYNGAPVMGFQMQSGHH